MRTFRFSDAKSHKFWRIEVSGHGLSLTVTQGEVGMEGLAATKIFSSRIRTREAVDKLIQEKTGEGYREIIRPTTPEAEALERGIVEHADEFVRWAVYSDYLTEQGDPRGEFMRIQLDLEDEALSAADRRKLKKREAAILAEHEREWLGPLAEFTLDEYGTGTRYRFERGWPASLDFANHEAFGAFAACKDARLIREVIVSPMWREEGADTLIDCPHLGAVRSLRIGEQVDVSDHGGQFSCGSSGENALPLVRRMPFLEHLEVYAQDVDMSALFALPLPRFRSITIFHPSRVFPLEKLAANKTMTNLTTIRCHPHCFDRSDWGSGAYIGLTQLRAICRSPYLTSLTHLCLRQTDFGDAGAKEIVQSGILKRLKVLDLYGGSMSDDGAKVLAACPDFKNLEFANLRMNALTGEGIKALRRTKVNVDVRDQHGNLAPDFRGPLYLYDGDIE